MKTLELVIEDWCAFCPNIDLETEHAYYDDNTKWISHQCKHTEFCQAVIAAYRRAEKENKNGNKENADKA